MGAAKADGAAQTNGSVTAANGALKQQTDPPTIPVKELYAPGNFPHGEEHEYLGG